jgi:hypothetical protein
MEELADKMEFESITNEEHPELLRLSDKQPGIEPGNHSHYTHQRKATTVSHWNTRKL